MNLIFFLLAALGAPLLSTAQDTAPIIQSFRLVDGHPEIRFSLTPSAQKYRVLLSPILPLPPGGASTEASGTLAGSIWISSLPAFINTAFYQVAATQLTEAEVTAGTLLNRIAYGPTPDELPRVRQMGIDAYIEEQLAPEKIEESLDLPQITGPVWRKVTVSGNGSASRLYIYLDGPGEAYLDDLRLVTGNSDPGTGPNLIANGDFEQSLSTNNWQLTPNVSQSARTTDFVHSGGIAFHLASTAAGSSAGDSVVQDIRPALSTSQTYTLSFWYLTQPVKSTLTIRLSGSGVAATTRINGNTESPAPYYAALDSGPIAGSTLTTLRAWHLLHAVQSRRQLSEIIRQFLENHFVTQYTKSYEYLDSSGGLPSEIAASEATRLEFKENIRWRDALLNPNCTFFDLLKVSAESPAMIIYLDTVNSRGDVNSTTRTNRIANENYGRELCELFTFGVDNGYDQEDIVQISRAWTGWTVELLNTNQVNNPFASRSVQYINPGVTNLTERNRATNLVGAWSFRYRTERHDPRTKWIFYNKAADGSILTDSPKRVPDRFGPPWAGLPYGLQLTNGSTTNGIQDGYRLLSHMANQPFTQEYISVKLCRLLVHEDFHHGYDFTDDIFSPEEDLIKACMLAWEIPSANSPKGQINKVLRVILHSKLFRSHLAAAAKVRTPLEFAASTLRAFRARLEDGTYTSITDAPNLADGILNKAGRMRLFDRAEPDGYPEEGAGWISAGTLAERLRFVQSLALAGANLSTTPAVRGTADSVGSGRINPSGLLSLKLGLDAASPEAVTDYLLDLLFHTEGQANLEAVRQVALQFLNTADDGTTPSPFSKLASGSRTYDGRVRGLVALLLSLPRFQEQ